LGREKNNSSSTSKIAMPQTRKTKPAAPCREEVSCEFAEVCDNNQFKKSTQKQEE